MPEERRVTQPGPVAQQEERPAGIKDQVCAPQAVVAPERDKSQPGQTKSHEGLQGGEEDRAGQAAAALCAGTTPSSSQIMELKNGPVVSYTVPQRIHMAADFQTVDVFFRVRAVCGKSRITVTDEAGTCLASFRRERLAPGEMENIKLPRKLLENAQGSITVSVEEDLA